MPKTRRHWTAMKKVSYDSELRLLLAIAPHMIPFRTQSQRSLEAGTPIALRRL